MAVVLVVRPWACSASRSAGAHLRRARRIRLGAARPRAAPVAALRSLSLLALAPLVARPLRASLSRPKSLIFALFAASLHLHDGPGGMASFGHAAYFGLGAYGAALAVKMLGLPMLPALLPAPLAAPALARCSTAGSACASRGVYLAMLTLAFAQIVWSIAFQWVGRPAATTACSASGRPPGSASAGHFYWLTLVLCRRSASRCLWRVLFSPFGYALRAARDSPLRAEAIGIDVRRIQWAAFVLAGAVAGLAGALFAFFKGSVFPDALGDLARRSTGW